MKKSIKIYLNLSILCCLLSFSAVAQHKNSAQLVDSNGDKIAGAEIKIVGSNTNTTSDSEGLFKLEAQRGDVVEIKVDNQVQQVIYKEDKAVWIFHNDQHKHIQNSATSSSASIASDKIEKNSVFNPANSLYGQLAGLTVLQKNGTPWSRNPQLIIRGKETTADNSVLLIVDGFERSLNTMSTLDIENITVLKDAAALAIYGQRGANGAIIVTTKRGKEGSFNVEAEYQYGIKTPTRTPQMLDGYQYAQAVNEARALDGKSFLYSQHDLNDLREGKNTNLVPNVDWASETLNDYAATTNFNTQFSGGGKNIRYFSSINYLTEKGLFKQTNLDDRYDSQLKYTRFNIRANVDADVTSTTFVKFNMSASLADQKYPNGGVNKIMKSIYNTPATAHPVKTVNGNWGGTGMYKNNPVALIAATGYRQDFERNLFADLTVKQELDALIEGLSAEIGISYDNGSVYYEGKTKPFEYENIDIVRDPVTGEIVDTSSRIYGRESDLKNVGGLSQWRRGALKTKLNYQKSWANDELYATLLYSQDKYVYDGHYHTYLRQNIATSFNYSHNSKYLCDLSLAYSGSSNLPKDNRFGFFPAVGLAWVASKEDFLKNNTTIGNLKVRASYGLTGSDLMSPNLYDQQIKNGGGYYFGKNYSSQKGLTVGQMATEGLTYETSIKSNIGVDMTLFNQLDITIDAYYNKRKDILVSTNGTTSSVIGIIRGLQNDGEVDSKGIETSVMWHSKPDKTFSYYIGGNFSYNQTEIINMNEAFRAYDYLKRTGNPVGQQYGLEAIGFFNNEEEIAASPVQTFSEVRPGDIKYKDQNGDNIINSDDVVAIGHSVTPEIYYGIQLGFEFKGFGVDAVFQGVANSTVYLNTPSIFWPLMNNTNISDFSANRWTPQNSENATLPRLTTGNNANNYQKNTIWLEDGDYLKLRSLDLHYNLPTHIANTFKLGHIKVFARGMNLFSIDKIKVVDPEAISTGYPTLASYHLGLNIGF